MVEHDPGTYEITREEVGTRYVVVIIRTFMDPGNEADIAAANGLQEQIEVSQSLAGEFKVPEWDADSLDTVRGLILALAATSTGGFTAAFGSKEEVDPIQHLMGTAAGWGGNPPEAATYFGGSPERNDGTVPFVLTTKDVPVEGFWSVTVYNARGFMEKNDRDVYSYNGVTAAKNSDGSTIVHFGACDDGRENCIPITEGWNYVIRLYRPGPEVLDGSWKFPEPRPVK